MNDSLGHAAGDQLLIEVADRLRVVVRPGDTIARLGGDEFAMLLEDLTVPHDALAAAERVLDTFRRPFRIQGREISLRASIGVAIGGVDGTGAEELLRNADVAMYSAKDRGRRGSRCSPPPSTPRRSSNSPSSRTSAARSRATSSGSPSSPSSTSPAAASSAPSRSSAGSTPPAGW